MTMMRIAMLAQADSRHTERWARWLADQGHTVRLFTDTQPQVGMDYAGVQIVPPVWSLIDKVRTFKLGAGPYANNWHKWRAYKSSIREFKPDILHAMEARAYGPTLKHFPDTPRVLTPWGTDMRCLNDEDLGRERPEEKRLVQQSVQHADVIATNAPGLESDWARQSGVHADKFSLFPWGIDASVFHSIHGGTDAEFLTSLGVDPGRRILLSPRLAQENYRIDSIIRGWLRAPVTNAQLVILRAGANTQSWQALKAHAAGGAGIHFVEKLLSPAELAALYRASEAFIMMPDDDLLSQSLLEGMACGSIPLLRAQISYESVVGDCDSRMEIKRAQGLLKAIPREADGLSIEVAAAELIARWNALAPEPIRSISSANATHVATNFDWKVCAQKMNVAYDIARANFRKRKSQTTTSRKTSGD